MQGSSDRTSTGPNAQAEPTQTAPVPVRPEALHYEVRTMQAVRRGRSRELAIASLAVAGSGAGLLMGAWILPMRLWGFVPYLLLTGFCAILIGITLAGLASLRGSAGWMTVTTHLLVLGWMPALILIYPAMVCMLPIMVLVGAGVVGIGHLIAGLLDDWPA